MSDELTEADRKAFDEAWQQSRGNMSSGRDAAWFGYCAALRRERARPAPSWGDEENAFTKYWGTRRPPDRPEYVRCYARGAWMERARLARPVPAAPEGLAKELHDAAMNVKFPEEFGDPFRYSPDYRAGFAHGRDNTAELLLTHPKLQPAAPSAGAQKGGCVVGIS